MDSVRQDVLVEVRASAARRLMATDLRVGEVVFRWEEVFRGPLAVAALEEGNETTWLVARPERGHPEYARWDWAHLVRRALPEGLVASGDIVSVEPATVPVPPRVALPLTSYEEVERPASALANCTPDGPDHAWPVGPGIAWHLGDEYTQLATARRRVEAEASGRRVRIGHVDTGYSADHGTVPERIRGDLGWNFWRDSSDTSDTLGGHFQGHGTRTISVLAGNRIRIDDFNDYLGGAPKAEVVPIVADGGIIITNLNLVYWARALEHAIIQKCDVVSMSAGGVWVDGGVIERGLLEVERRGVVVVAAAGNRYCGPRDMVWPARYGTVIAVTGAMADHKPYHYECSLRYFSSCWGPNDAMGTVLAAYTPNVTAARYGCPKMVDYNASGTSHATPQVAAAAALWIQLNGHRYPDSTRAAAARRALFSSARKVPESAWMFGNGILRANDALKVTPEVGELRAGEPVELDAAVALGAIPELAGQPPLVRTMLEREAAEIRRRIPEVDGGERLTATASAPRLSTEALGGHRASALLREVVGAG